MRVFLPATTVELASLHGTGDIAAAASTAFAVTAGLRDWYGEDDLEELEYAALLEAARASLRLIDTDPAALPRRVVIAAEVSDDALQVRDDLDRGVVRLNSGLTLAEIVSVHIDDANAEEAISVAAEAITRADLGDEEAQEKVDDAEGFELAWYATQEIGELLKSLV